MNKVSLLVVDDEPAFLRLLSLSLGKEGFDVHTAMNGEDALDLAAEIHPDAVILDLALPGAHGLDVLSELRERSDMPVIVVTGSHTPEDVKRGLDRGADDYITKPFSPTEVSARIRAVLRRHRRSSHRRHVIGRCVVDLEHRTLTPAEPGEAGGPPFRPQSIGRGGWRLLETLISNEGRILYPDELLNAAFGPAYRGDGGYLQDQVRRLRRGLGIAPWTEGPIRTVHGVGYAYDPKGELPVGSPRRPRAVTEPDGAADARHGDDDAEPTSRAPALAGRSRTR